MWKLCTTAAEMIVPSVCATSSGEFATDGPSMRKVERLEQPDVRHQPPEEVGEQVDRLRGAHQVPRRVHRPLAVRRRDALHEDGHLAAFLDDRDRYPHQPLLGPDGVVEEDGAVDAVVDLPQPLRRQLARTVDQPAQTARHGGRAPALDLAEDAVAHPQAGRDARAQLDREHERVCARSRTGSPACPSVCGSSRRSSLPPCGSPLRTGSWRTG